MAQQSYKNHVRVHPLFHVVLMPLCLFLLGATVWLWFHERTFARGVGIVAAFTLMLLAFVTRRYALKVQDRVIRLEETLRIASLGGAPTGISAQQCVALRFASDPEVVSLAERAVRDQLAPAQIKEAVQEWRADHHRV